MSGRRTGPIIPRVAVVTTLVVLLIGAVGITAVTAMQRLQSAVVHLESRSEAAVLDVELARSAFERRVAASRGFLLTHDPEFALLAQEARESYAGALDRLAAMATEPHARALVRAVVDAERRYDAAIGGAEEVRRRDGLGPSVEAYFADEVVPRRAEVSGALDTLLSDRAEHLAQRREQALQNVQRSRFLVELITALASGLALLLVMFEVRVYRRTHETLRRWTEFLAVATHDLRTPLTSLSLRLQALERDERRGAVAHADLLDRVRRMRTLVDRMSALLADLLDATRIRLGRLVLERSEVELGALVEEVVEQHEEKRRAAHTELRVLRSQPLIGQWDRRRIEQVVANLVGNALVHGAGAPVEIELSRVNGLARLQVRDRGPGVPRAEQRAIFERFHRGTQEGSGHGLGLWIARVIVVEHGGTIRLESEPGEGATFTVDLPLQASAPEPRTRPVPWRREQPT